MSSVDGEKYSDIPMTPRDSLDPEIPEFPDQHADHEHEMKEPVLKTAYQSDSALKVIVIPNAPNLDLLKISDEDVISDASWVSSQMYSGQRSPGRPGDAGPQGHVQGKSRWRSEGHLKGQSNMFHGQLVDTQLRSKESMYTETNSSNEDVITRTSTPGDQPWCDV